MSEPLDRDRVQAAWDEIAAAFAALRPISFDHIAGLTDNEHARAESLFMNQHAVDLEERGRQVREWVRRVREEGS